MTLQPAHTLLAGVLVLAASVVSLCFCEPADAADPGELQDPWSRGDDGWLLRAPSPDRTASGPKVRAQPKIQGPFYALAYQYETRVLERASRDARPVGIVRRGTTLSATKRVSGKGCTKGDWYAIAGVGYACSQDGFLVSRAQRKFWLRQPRPELNAQLPFRYGRVITPGALRFHRLPSEREQAQIEARLAASKSKSKSSKAKRKPDFPDVVQDEMVGDYFVALDRIERARQQRYYRTVRGRYVRVEDVEPREPPKMHGVVLSTQLRLPFAFVFADGDAPLFELRKGVLRPAGRAEVHARFAVREKAPPGHPELVPTAHGLFVPRERVRIARGIRRPKDIPPRTKWIHVNLGEQTLVAYEGDVPVFATLVSTGKEESGHATPTGLYRIREKHVTVTMSGDDPVDGHYEVAEVPWTQFYQDSYALHGAYWHDTFGTTRSHGCTNVSPPDARWLFHWTTPGLPDGFHARREIKGTYVYLTR